MKRFLLIPVCCALLTACTTDGDYEDLRQWMSEASRNLKGKVPSLPEVKPYEPVAYDVENLVDPFKSTRVIPEKAKGGGGAAQPDFDRPREPLEAYPLESLKYVGVMTRQKEASYAIISVDGSLYQVKAGNYLGQNFGVITKIDESEVVLKELVQDAAGDWIERASSLLLQGQEVTK
ncbi:MAG: pilus assembly protein PilP [Candidatus Accumulibacter sp.]|jgi:type IV pilus assembly protein PilP|nr:pilus assembly protein PilP [Accumulibacter sp.]